DFIIEVGKDIPGGLLLDELRLRQIILNLLGNAVKFTSKGHIKLAVNIIYSREDFSYLDLIFSVNDTGEGIPPEQKEVIFEAFKQKSGQDQMKYGGTGLGLSISRRLIEMMGGEINVESQLGVGTTFMVTLKGVPVASVCGPTAENAPAFEEEIEFENASILIVDDILTNRKLLKAFLDYPAFSLLEAENGIEALRVTETCRPNLVLMDMKMPDMNGQEAFRRLKDNESLKSIPVVMVTASAMKNEELLMLELGCDGFLRKPVLKTELLTEVKRFLPHIIINDNTNDNAAGTGKDGKQKTLTISPQTAEKLPELIDLLNENIMPKWKKTQACFIFEEIESFALEVKEMGKRYKLELLVDWADVVLHQAEIFDMEKMPETLAYFPELIKQLEGEAQKRVPKVR
ncbi:MAG: response regulator, partial [bacterium]|nr:response regulator [bacterium]